MLGDPWKPVPSPQCCAARPGRPWTRDKSPAFLPTEALSHPQLLREATEATEYKAGLKGWRVWVPGRHRAGRRGVATVAVGGADGEEPRVEVGHDFPTWGENFTSPSLVWEPLRRAGKVLDTLMRQVNPRATHPVRWLRAPAFESQLCCSCFLRSLNL